MADQDKKEEDPRIAPTPERNIPAGEQTIHFKHGPEGTQEKIPERREVSPDDEIVSAELRREIEMMELDPSKKKEAEAQREKIEFLGEKEKIEHLLQMARERGLVFSVQVAKKMNEPYLLDILHDTLAQEGFYKDFISQVAQKAETRGGGRKLFVYIIIGLVVIFCIFVIYKLWR